jgi:hypothetical protein
MTDLEQLALRVFPCRRKNLPEVIGRIVLETNGLWRGFHPDEPRKTRRQIPAFTASIDATWPYIPAHCLPLVRELWDNGTKSGYASLHCYRNNMWDGDHNGDAKTTALALAAAVARARQTRQTQEGGDDA